MATLSLSSALVSDQNGTLRHSNAENGTDNGHDVVLSNLMMKLQMTSKQIKAWSQTSHKLRLAMSKYTEPDPVDPTRLQKCLDKLKMAIKVSSLPAMNERLDSIARQVGLKANWSIERTDVYFSSDCFYVEVLLAPNGSVKDVKLVHGMTGNPQSCAEMCEVLKKNDFKEFTDHLKGLCQMYQLGGDSKMKSTAFNCLQALEIDLKTVFQIGGAKIASSQTSGTPVSPLLHIAKGPIGHLTPRVGGHPTRLTYFVSPYDLLDVEKKQTTELSNKDPLPKDLGLSVTVAMEKAAAQRKIQTTPTIIVTDNKITNILQLTNQNSITILASFVLKLSQPMPMSIILMKQLQNIPGVSTQYADLSAPTPLNTLICRFTQDPFTLLQTQAKDGRHRVNSFNVELPDQRHTYIINDASDVRDMQGALLSKITFVAPNNVVKIVSLLRQQAVYNNLVASCVRSKDKDDSCDAVLFEVTPYTHQKLTVTFEHPAKDGVACLELDLTDHTSVKARLHTRPGEEPFCTDEYATRVLQKCLSIPVTMRAIMKKAEQWQETYQPKKPVSLSPPPSSGQSGGSAFDPVGGLHRHGGHGGGHGGSFFSGHRPHQSSSSHHQLHSHSILSDLTTTMSAILPHGESFDMHGDKPTKVAQNPMLASLLQHAALSGAAAGTASIVIPPPSPSPISSPPLASGPKPNKNPMLMNLLQEHNPLTAVAAIAQPVSQLGRPGRKGKRVRSTSADKSPKRQQSEDDHDMDDLTSHRAHHQLQQRLTDAQKMTSHMMEPPRPAPHTGELSALLSEINEPIIPVKPKRGRPCRLDSASSQSSVSARQSPKTPSTPSVPTTPTYIPPKPMSHSTLSTPEHPSMDDMHSGIKPEQLHHRHSIDSDIFSHNSKNLFTEELLAEQPRSNISPETGRRASFKSQYSLDSLDINEDLLKSAEGFDNDDEFGGLPMVSSAIARMGIPTGSEFDEQHRTTTDLPPVSMSPLTGPLSTAIQAGLETRTDMAKMSAGVLDLSVPNLTKSMSIPDMSTGHRGRQISLANVQGVTDLSQSLPLNTRPRVPVSKGKPKNFTESGLARQVEGTRKGSKKRTRKGLKDTGGFSDSDAPKKKRGRQRKKIEYSSESSPEPCQDYPSITMAVNKEQPLKMTFKKIHKPEKEQKLRTRESGPAPKIKIRAMTSGDSATPSPNPIVRDMRPEEKLDVKVDSRMDLKTEKVDSAARPTKVEHPLVKSEVQKEMVVHKDEITTRPSKDFTPHMSEDHTSKGTSHELSKGMHNLTTVKSEHVGMKSAGVVRPSAPPKGKNEFIKKVRSLDSAQRASPQAKSPIADFFPKKNLSSLPRIPKLSKTVDNKQSPNSNKTSTPPKPGSTPSPNAKTVFVSSPKKQVWAKGDPSKVGTAKKLISTQRMGSISPTGRKPDGSKVGIGKQFSSVNKSPLLVGQTVRKQGPNILSKSLTSPSYGPNSSKASTGMVQGVSRNVMSASQGLSKAALSPVKQSGSVSPVPRTLTGNVTKSQSSVTGVKLQTMPTSSVPSKLSGSHGISLVTTSKVSAANVSVPSASSAAGSTSLTVSTKVSTSSSNITGTATSIVRTSPVPSTASLNSSQSSSSGSVMPSSSASAVTIAPSTSISSASQAVAPLPTSVAATSKTSSVAGAKTGTSGTNRPPPLNIPQNIKVPPPSVTSPPTPTSVSTPTSAGPNSGKLGTPKPGMRGARKFSLMGIIDKIKEDKIKEEKVEKVEKVEKTPEKAERVGLFSALESGTSGVSESVASSEDKERPDAKDIKDSTPEIHEEGKLENQKTSKPLVSSKSDIDAPTKETKGAEPTAPITKADNPKPSNSKVSAVGSHLPSRQPSPSPSSKPSGLVPSPSTQTPGMVKSKSSPKHSSQSRPPKVSTPPLSGSQKRASSPTGKIVSVKQNKPSPLSASSTSTSASLNSPVKTSARPGTSPVSRSRPIILSHTSSTYQSPEKGQQKVTKVQLAVQPNLVQSSLLGGSSSSSSVGKMQMASSQARVPSPSIKSQIPPPGKQFDSIKKSTNVVHKPATDNAKPEAKQVMTSKQSKSDQGALLKPKPCIGKETNVHLSQSNVHGEPKGSSDTGGTKVPSASMKKSETKPSDPRVRRDAFGPGKDKDPDYPVKVSKPALVRTVSKEAKGMGNTGNQDGKGSSKGEVKFTVETSQKPKTTPPLAKTVSHEAKKPEKDKPKNDDARKVDPKLAGHDAKGADKQESAEESTKNTATAKSQAIDFKVPSPAMVPSPRSPKPVIKPVLSPKPVAYSPQAPSPHSSSGQEPGNAPSPKAAPKRAATPVNVSQPPPAKKARQVAPPYSPVDSDEDFSMVIDMPQSPRSAALKPQRSPRPESRSSNTQTEAGSTSPRSAVAHSPLGQIAQSPLGIGKSPASVKSIGSDSISRSPCRIDDDLMDEVLTTSIHPEDV